MADDDDEGNASATPPRVAGRRAVGYYSYANNVLSYDMNRPAGTAYYHKPRGSWKIKKIYAIAPNGAHRARTIYDSDVYVKFEVTEPLLLSPYIFGSGYGKQGFYGIQNMTFSMVVNGGNANRAWRCASLDNFNNKESYSSSILRGLSTASSI
ncbi:MAG: phage major capsid domain-containing protein, partial [Candidatus Fonsibacter sp.]